jgi:hypothetical protein
LSTGSFLSVQARNENIKRMDKNIISKLMVFILSEIELNKRKNRLFRDSFKDYTKERIKPLFNIRYFVKNNINTKKYRNMTPEERRNIREICRNKIERPKQFEGSLVEEMFEDKYEKKEKEPVSHLKFITKINLGWLNITEEVATHEPQISAIEEHMKLAILTGLDSLNNLKKVDLKGK